VQEDGVDEADLLRSDGRHLHALVRDGEGLAEDRRERLELGGFGQEGADADHVVERAARLPERGRDVGEALLCLTYRVGVDGHGRVVETGGARHIAGSDIACDRQGSECSNTGDVGLIGRGHSTGNIGK
jgi:hypothetical protein